MENVQTFHSVCPHDCPSTCALDIEYKGNNRIGRIHGARDQAYTAGIVCAKVARYYERQHHKDRLTMPMQRIGDKGCGIDGFKPIFWDQALDNISEKLIKIAAIYGPEAIWPYFYAGTMGLVQRDGIQRLRHVMGYSGQKSTICTTLADQGWMAGVGIKYGVDAREIEHSDLIIMWGGNPVATQVNLMTHITKARKEKGAKFIVIDPYRTATAESADQHLMVKPGTDGALACAMMHVLFKEDYIDWDYVHTYTDDPEGLKQHLVTRTPEWASSITGLSTDEITDFAKLYGQTKRSFIRIGYGFSRSRNGSVNVHAVTCLPALTGAWRYEGGGALYSQGRDLYKLDKTLIEGLDYLNPNVRMLDQSRIGPILNGNKTDLGNGPPIKALFIQNTNPINVCPDSNQVYQGMSRKDLFICVHEQFLTETASMADIVLPATTFLEHDDFYVAGGHTYLQLGPKILEPLGQARSNHWVICELAKRLGAKHPGFNLTEIEIIDQTLKMSGKPGIDYFQKNKWLDCALDFKEAHFLNGYGHKDRKFHFKPNWSFTDHSGSLPLWPDYYENIDQSNDIHPFRLVTAPARQFLNTTFTQTPTSRKRENRPTLLIHPQDCYHLNIKEGDLVTIGNKQGSLKIHVKFFDGVQPGVVVVESIWPSKDFVEGKGINVLTSVDPGFPAGGAVFHDTAIWIKSDTIR
ncbi:MAG: molybdopterin oxidoreductase family protein [Alphaproteobacteria bacterium]|nr:molybdopterin oxidoreductase family protein [Alphaproteobacteria bacterium]